MARRAKIIKAKSMRIHKPKLSSIFKKIKKFSKPKKMKIRIKIPKFRGKFKSRGLK